jgi:putative FmdB family regulatory protein
VPRYDYRCEAGHKYEKQEPFGSPAEHPCQRCGKPAHRLLVAPPLVFKGSGFYKTANRSMPGDSSDSPSKSASSKPSAGKSESNGAAAETRAKRAERVQKTD